MLWDESCIYCRRGEYHYFHHYILDFETDPRTIARRAKQLAYGFRTIEHQQISHIPKDDRPIQCPKTPTIEQKCSRRDFDAQIKRWRKRLHTWTKSKAKTEQEEISKKSDRLTWM